MPIANIRCCRLSRVDVTDAVDVADVEDAVGALDVVDVVDIAGALDVVDAVDRADAVDLIVRPDEYALPITTSAVRANLSAISSAAHAGSAALHTDAGLLAARVFVHLTETRAAVDELATAMGFLETREPPGMKCYSGAMAQ